VVKRTILALSEDAGVREVLRRLVASAGWEEADSTCTPSAILIGCRGHIAKNDLALAQAAAGNDRRIPILLITAQGSEELAIEALRAGMANYLRLPLSPEQLSSAIETAAGPASADRLLGTSKAIREMKAHLLRVAACASTVLITGETGTGKELAAELIHRHSTRAVKPMMTINCAAIPDSLLESELFGFERGAFTGAHAARDGKLRSAAGGTVFLDEIGDLSPYAQAKLLRVIESGEIQRLGGQRPLKIDVRIIAATNRNLESDPSFRRDLYFRLNVARIVMPPLRDRPEDILPIADAFRIEFSQAFGCATAGFGPGVRETLLAHTWPGNIRELRNILEAAFVHPGPDTDGLVHLPPAFRSAVQTSRGTELEQILKALAATHWNRSRAAEELHWSRMTLYRKMAKYNVRRPRAAGE
jgi:DNA-binding NtrC family response regulator